MDVNGRMFYDFYGFIRNPWTRRLPEVRSKLGSQQHIPHHLDPSLAGRSVLTPLAWLAVRLISSSTLGSCFLFSDDWTFTRVFGPMQGSPLEKQPQ